MVFEKIYQTLISLLCVFVTTQTLSTNAAKAQDHEITTYDTAQRLVCLRDGKVGLDRPVVFQLKVTKYSGGVEYRYREGRIGGRSQSFAIRPEEVTCTATPVEGPEAEPVRVFEGVHSFGCVDNGIMVIKPLWADRVVERGTETALVYDYWVANGPPSKPKHTLMISLENGFCDIKRRD